MPPIVKKQKGLSSKFFKKILLHDIVSIHKNVKVSFKMNQIDPNDKILPLVFCGEMLVPLYRLLILIDVNLLLDFDSPLFPNPESVDMFPAHTFDDTMLYPKNGPCYCLK